MIRSPSRLLSVVLLIRFSDGKNLSREGIHLILHFLLSDKQRDDLIDCLAMTSSGPLRLKAGTVGITCTINVLFGSSYSYNS